MDIAKIIQDREEARLTRIVQDAQLALEAFISEGKSVDHLMTRTVSNQELGKRYGDLLIGYTRNAPKGFVPRLMLDRWPIVDPSVRVKTSVNKDTRRLTLKRDMFCRWCRVEPSTTVDHILPKARGGDNHRSNLVGSCALCNQFKADFLPAELGWKLKYRPYEMEEPSN